MRRKNYIYALTIIAIVAGLFWIGLSLLRTAMPSADVVAANRRANPQFLVSDFVIGQPATLVHDGIVIFVWRRDAEQIFRAGMQDHVAQWTNPMSNVSGKANMQPANDANLTIDQEWLIVNGQDLSGRGCVVFPKGGDFGGFFDPCRGSHFDLAGRIRKGPSTSNLQVISGKLSDDGTYLELDLTGVLRFSR